MRGGGSGRGHGKGQYGSSHNHHLHHSALCCLSAAPPLPGDATPTLTPEPEAAAAASGPAVAVEGVLHKWTNYGRGWRERWFSLRDGVLSYSKIRAADAGSVARAGARAQAGAADGDGEVRLIGSRVGGARRTEKPAGVVFLKVRLARPCPFLLLPCGWRVIPAGRTSHWWGRFRFVISSSRLPVDGFSPHS